MKNPSPAVIVCTIISTIVLLCLYHPVSSASIPGYPDEGHWYHGSTTTMEHWGSGTESLVLYGNGTALMVADAMNSGAMTLLGEINTGYLVSHIDIADDGLMAAVTDRDKWVTLVDISNRSAPSILGRYEVEDGRSPFGAAFGATHLYVAIGPAGLWALDLADPSMPTLAGSYIEPGTDFVFDVEVLGNHAFLADDDDGVTAIDISDPTTPTFAGRFAGATDASHITIDGTTAYVSRRGFGFHILDLSAAPAMTELGSFTNPSGGIIYRTEVIDGSRVVCADGSEGLLVMDVSNPAAPVIESTDSRDMFVVATDGTTAYSTQVSYFSNPRIFEFVVDTAAPFDPPNLVGSLPLMGENVGVAISGSTILIANETGGAFLLDATNPANLQTTSEVDLGTQSLKVLALVGPTLAYGAFGHDLGLVDLTDPAAPVLLPDYVMPGAGYASDVINLPGTTSVIVGAGPEGVTVIDLANPLAPGVVGSWTPAMGAVLHVDLDADRIAAGGGNNVWVVDASTISTPVEHTSFTVTATVLDVEISGDHVYVATNSQGVRVWDISNPVTPSEVGVFSTSPTSANGISVLGDRMYVAADTFWGMIVVDISDPTAPIGLQAIFTPGKATKVAATGNHIALADGNGGVFVWGESVEVSLFTDGFESGDTSIWSSSAP